MKIARPAYCEFCYEEAKQKGEKYFENSIPPAVLIELNEKGIYSWKCPNNHINWFFLDEQLFQTLFDLGALALSDGYTREAVSSFVASLERFYEFVIKIILLADDTNEDLITNSWKELWQSERQLGAYIILFLNKIKVIAPIPKAKWIKFRNDVIHKGIIPNEKEALEYGKMVGDLIYDVLFILKDFYKEDLRKIIHKVRKYRNELLLKENPQIKKEWYSSGPNIIQLRFPEFKRIDLAYEIESIRNTSNKKLKIGKYFKG